MLDSIPVILMIGSLLGFLAGIGVGGGSLLVLWLTAVMNYPPESARAINLLFFVPSALIATFFRWKQGALQPVKLLPAIIAGCIAAVLFSRIGTALDTQLLKKFFGWLLIFAGLRELFYKKKAS